MALATFLFSLLTWRYLATITKDRWLAFAFTVPLVLNPWLVTLKGNVISDIPFACAALGLVILLRQTVTVPRAVGIGVLAGFATLLRSAGIAIFAALGAYFIYCVFSKAKAHANIPNRRFAWIFGSAIGVFVVFQYVIYPTPSLGTYVDSVSISAVLREISKNADYYLRIIRDLIPNAGPVIFQTLLYHSVVVGVIAGFFIEARRAFGYREWFVLAYLGLLITWSGLQGFRLLLPLAPIGMGYLFTTLRTVFPNLCEGKRGAKFALGIVLVTLVVFYHPVRSLQKTVATGNDGPQMPEAQQAFVYVGSAVPKEGVVAFRKPRILALYSGRQSLADVDGSSTEIAAYFKRKNVTHILVDYLHSEPSVQKMAGEHGQSLWKNERFELFSFSRN
jgi:hypothetical protein